MASASVSHTNPKAARIGKLCGLVSVVFFMSASIPVTNTAATPNNGAGGHHHYANMTIEHWQDNNYDQYFKTYPNGNVLTFPEYVQNLGIPEHFECGVDKQHSCHISPLGQSLSGPNWYILSATSIWNSYTNSLVYALRKSTSLAKAVVHEILMDLVYEYNPQTSIGLLSEVDLINIILLPIEQGGNQDPRVSEETHELDWVAAIKPIVTPPPSLQTVQPAKYNKMKRHLVATEVQEPMIVFNSSKPAEANLHELSHRLHGMLVESIENKLSSPISLETGIYSALEHGRFASPKVDPARLADNAQSIASLFTVSALLNHQNAMIVVRKSNCSQHRKQIESDPSRLAFCSSDNTLIEIILVDGENNYMRDIYNAHLIRDKYGFKTSFLASEALRCQTSINNARNNQADEEEEPTNENPYDVCTFRLPICNLVDQKYENLLHDSGNLVRICREKVGVPI